MTNLKQSPLGHEVEYTNHYNPQLLYPIERQQQRSKLGLITPLPFQGSDIWHSYEMSWLHTSGKPQVAIARFSIPCESPCLIESKSFKLYLNSFNQSEFADRASVQQHLVQDLQQATGNAEVTVELFSPQQFSSLHPIANAGVCLDKLEVSCHDYEVKADNLLATGELVTEMLYSDLFRSICLVTSQPDWANITISYRGQQIDHAGLLKYLVSYRCHADLHETCVERIFQDIQQRCQPEKLAVYARFTRRGGIDINPYRSNFEPAIKPGRDWRQ